MRLVYMSNEYKVESRDAFLLLSFRHSSGFRFVGTKSTFRELIVIQNT